MSVLWRGVMVEKAAERAIRNQRNDDIGFIACELEAAKPDQNNHPIGTLRGLSNERLSKALMAMHEQPGQPWSVDQLAGIAGMSRDRFAAHFREIVGTTPMAHLTDWRIGIEQTMLRRGEPLKSIAPAVDYESSTALSRIFTQSTGQSPTSGRPEIGSRDNADQIRIAWEFERHARPVHAAILT